MTAAPLVTFNLILVAVFTFLAYLVYHFKKRYDHWRKLDVPFLGIKEDIVFDWDKNRTYAFQDRYNKLDPLPYGGIFQATKPILLLRDPELIKAVMIKDFAHFTDRGIVFDEKLDPLMPHLFNLGGQRWKSVRAKLTPTFSSGKLKSMFTLMEGCIQILDQYLTESLDGNGQSKEIDVLRLMSELTTDVIGTCAFGWDCGAIGNEGSEFRRISKKFSINRFKFFLRMACRSINPKIFTWLRWKGFDPEVEAFYLNITKEAVEKREENKEKRKDFLQLLINVQHEEQKMLQSLNDGSEPLFKDHVVAAQVFIFFLAGFDTTANTLTYCLYELALHPDITAKLHAEITRVLKAYDGKVTYESLKEMHYMDTIVSETLRKYPPLGFLDRVCTKAYELPNSSLLIKPDTSVMIPVYALHYDPKYYPDPEKFDPDRFSEENKGNLVPGTYFPFGDGPRICIGMRFAQMEIKSALSLIVRKYTVHTTDKTPIPATFKTNSFINRSAQPITLTFKRRDS